MPFNLKGNKLSKLICKIKYLKENSNHFLETNIQAFKYLIIHWIESVKSLYAFLKKLNKESFLILERYLINYKKTKVSRFKYSFKRLWLHNGEIKLTSFDFGLEFKDPRF